MATQFPTYAQPNQRIRKRPPNPYDKSTVVSVLPKVVDEYKPTIDPGKFYIPAAKFDDFEILVVGASSWFKEIDHASPLIEIINSSIEVAKSIVTDYCNGVIGCDMGDKMPGLFWIPGSFDKKSIFGYVREDGKKFEELLAEARQKQKNWYVELVTLADSDWSNSNGHPMSISDDMKLAANALSLDKPWLYTSKNVTRINCKSCGTLVDPNYPICFSCKNPIGGLVVPHAENALGFDKLVNG